MAESTLKYDNIVDLRFNPATEEYSPKGIGYGANATENHIIPSSSPYIIKLFEAPQQNAPSTTVVTIDGTELTEVSNTVTPGANQYRVWYYPELGQGQIEFNSANAGKEAQVKYYGLGTIHQKTLLDTRVPSTGDTTIAGNKTFTGANTFTSANTFTGETNLEGGSTRGELGTLLKEKIISIGSWDMYGPETTNDNKTVSHGMTAAQSLKIRSVCVMIINDAGTELTPLGGVGSFSSADTINGGVYAITSTAITLFRNRDGRLNSYPFGLDEPNRGWIYILYED